MTALRPELLEEARQLTALARRWVSESGMGQHRSRRLGGGSEFREHKAYAPGDDLRRLDWKVLGRTDRLVIKRFESDRQAEVWIVLDRSRSMAFGTTGGVDARGLPRAESKWQAASIAALVLAHVFLRQGDRVGLRIVDGQGSAVLPARGGERQLMPLAAACLERPPVGRAELGPVLSELLASRRRCVAIVISDLLDEEQAWLQPLQVHAARGRDAWLLHVVDPAEISFPYEEPAFFEDLEDAGRLGLDPRSIARAYRETFAAFLAQTEKACLDAGVHHLRLDPAQGPIEPLRRWLG